MKERCRTEKHRAVTLYEQDIYRAIGRYLIAEAEFPIPENQAWQILMYGPRDLDDRDGPEGTPLEDITLVASWTEVEIT